MTATSKRSGLPRGSAVLWDEAAHFDGARGRVWVRLASRRMWGELLESGVRMFEYGGGMTHVKALLVDDLWSVIGTANLDNRSFEHNDEVNVAMRDPAVADRLLQDYERTSRPAMKSRSSAGCGGTRDWWAQRWRLGWWRRR